MSHYLLNRVIECSSAIDSVPALLRRRKVAHQHTEIMHAVFEILRARSIPPVRHLLTVSPVECLLTLVYCSFTKWKLPYEKLQRLWRMSERRYSVILVDGAERYHNPVAVALDVVEPCARLF
jgi:hypothetical protein